MKPSLKAVYCRHFEKHRLLELQHSEAVTHYVFKECIFLSLFVFTVFIGVLTLEGVISSMVMLYWHFHDTVSVFFNRCSSNLFVIYPQQYLLSFQGLMEGSQIWRSRVFSPQCTQIFPPVYTASVYSYGGDFLYLGVLCFILYHGMLGTYLLLLLFLGIFLASLYILWLSRKKK